MTPPLPPRPKKPSYSRFDEQFSQAVHDTLPPAAKKAHSERDVKIDADTMAMARAITSFQVQSNAQHEQLVKQVAALHAHLIQFHAWASRNAWMRSPVTRLVVTAIGAAVGAYAALQGAKP